MPTRWDPERQVKVTSYVDRKHLFDKGLREEEIKVELALLDSLRPIPLIRSAKRIARKRELLARRLKGLETPDELIMQGEEKPPLWDEQG